MPSSTRTPEGEPNQCPVCGKVFALEPSIPLGDAPCPHCGSLVWFPRAPSVAWSAGFPVFWVKAAEACNKEEAVHAVVGRLAVSGCLRKEDCNGIASAILKRESLGTTAIGRGVAVPHGTYAGVDKVVGALAR